MGENDGVDRTKAGAKNFAGLLPCAGASVCGGIWQAKGWEDISHTGAFSKSIYILCFRIGE